MILIIMGESGSGKDTLLRELVQNHGFQPIISTTTRPMREGEVDGRDYYFVSQETFLKRLENNEFLEHRAYNTTANGKPVTWYYGAEKQELDPDTNYAVVLDTGGAWGFLMHYGKLDCFVIQVQVSEEIRKQRAIRRGTFNEQEWNTRVSDDAERFCAEQTKGIVETVITNEMNLDDTVSALLEIIEDRKASIRDRLLKDIAVKFDDIQKGHTVLFSGGSMLSYAFVKAFVDRNGGYYADNISGDSYEIRAAFPEHAEQDYVTFREAWNREVDKLVGCSSEPNVHKPNDAFMDNKGDNYAW